MKQIFLVYAEWDYEEKVWIASSNDIQGLIAEAESIETLSTKLQSMAPELLLLNERNTDEEIIIEIIARKYVKTQAMSE
jgi:predicted RNase H-like HicB family nuclease